MASEFDKLLAKVKKMNSVEGEECMICHFPDSTDNLIKLKCSHYYHKDCIGINLKSTVPTTIKCPYCKAKTKWTNKISNKNNNKGNKINYTNTPINTPKISPIKPKKLCFEIIKSGSKKGMVCGRTNCKYHSKKIKIDIPPLNTCQSIIKSGIRKGMVCGRTNCKYHKPILNITV